MSSENQSLEDVFPTYINSPFLGDMLVFRGVHHDSLIQQAKSVIFCFPKNAPKGGPGKIQLLNGVKIPTKMAFLIVCHSIYCLGVVASQSWWYTSTSTLLVLPTQV